VSKRQSGFHSVGDILSEALKQRRLEKRTKQEVAAGKWADVVGERAAAASRPEAIRDGILFVACKSAAWAQELTLLKDRVVQELNKRAGSKVITDVRFSGSGLPKSSEASVGEEQEQPSPKEIHEVTLNAAELSRVEKAAEGIQDEDLAEKIRGALRSRLKLERWRLQHGWPERPP